MHYLHLKDFVNLKVIKRNKGYLLVFCGLVIFLFGAINYYNARILSFNNSPKATSSTTGNKPTEIEIPTLNIKLTVEEGSINNGIWQISDKNATHLNTSADPGTKGNIVIYGHNKKAIFGSIPYLKTGETIVIKDSSGKIHKYKVDEKIWASPDRVDLVSPTNTETLTIYTCWGLFDQERVILKASPLN